MEDVSEDPGRMSGSCAEQTRLLADTLQLQEYRSGAGNPAHSHVLGSLPGRPTSTPPCFANEECCEQPARLGQPSSVRGASSPRQAVRALFHEAHAPHDPC